ncbi:MAG: hypothetical protein ACXWU5_03355 [Rhodoplanes sp.]
MDPPLHEIVIGHGRAEAEMMRRVTAVDLGGQPREPIEEHGLVRFQVARDRRCLPQRVGRAGMNLVVQLETLGMIARQHRAARPR